MKLEVQLKEHSYPIWIEQKALSHIADYIDPDRRYAIVTDDHVPQQWVDLLIEQLENACVISFEHGEKNKSLKTYEYVQEQLIKKRFGRKDAVIALGGGVVGDLAGFVAATYMRGIDFYNIPTTLLSQVDSSVGGKVAVDMGTVKNIIGAFYQPKAVIIDPDTLSTLDPRQVRSGAMEALKMGLILDEELVKEFEKDELDYETIIARSIDLKRMIVENDEKELGQRAILNFGHTIGHAIEGAYAQVPYYHGECVGMGMLFFIEDEKLKERVRAILDRFEIPSVPDYDPDTLLSYIVHDKKGSADSVKTIRVKKAGSYEMQDMTYDEIRTVLLRGGV